MINSKNIISIGLFFLVFLVIIIIYKYINTPSEINSNNKKLHENISNMRITDGVSIQLNSITPFEWDTIYIFSPYFPKSEIEDIIGIKSSEIRTTTSDEMFQMIFIYSNKIVSSISDSITLNFQFKFENSKGYIELHSTDNPMLKVDTSVENITVFNFINP